MKAAFLFPGQGAQKVAMGKDFYDQFPIAKETFEEADDRLKRKLSTTIFKGPEKELTLTSNSQLAIFVTSIAMYRVLASLYSIQPEMCAGLSLGEYTALCAAGFLDFSECLTLVKHRGEFMHQCCERVEGRMAVVLGLSDEKVQELSIPDQLWIANLNCPGQVVISGTVKGVEVGGKRALALGAKRVLPLNVHGAFHSGLMSRAQENLSPYIDEAAFKESDTPVVMNVTGKPVREIQTIKELLKQQVTHSVLWEEGIHQMKVERFIEFGPGRSLSGLNRKIGITSQMQSIDNIEDLKEFE
ncbi:MAG: ACP S-malonyltransferase [Waddliaceae bacterium]